jgi:hypothetical protein
MSQTRKVPFIKQRIHETTAVIACFARQMMGHSPVSSIVFLCLSQEPSHVHVCLARKNEYNETKGGAVIPHACANRVFPDRE